MAAEFSGGATGFSGGGPGAPAGIAFHNSLGGAALMERNRRLAAEAASMLADAWRTEIAGLPAQRAAVASIRVPKAPAELGRLLHDRLLDKHGIQLPFFTIKVSLWLR